MNSVFAVLLVITCALAQDFNDLKRLRIEIDSDNDPLAKDVPLVKDSKPGNDSESKFSLTGRIINGFPAVSGQIPWQVVISIDNAYMCGGSIIDAQWIMTAAHCARGFTNFRIRMGITDLRSAGQLRITTTKIVNALYNTVYYYNDIAVLKVDRITFGLNVKAIQLPRISDASKTFAGTSAMVSGFGLTASKQISNTLQFAPVTVISNEVCRSAFGPYVASTNICTIGSNNRGTCNGDSGGPLVYWEGTMYTQIGIVSYGSSTCLNAPSGFTRVTSYLNWIRTNTGIYIRP